MVCWTNEELVAGAAETDEKILILFSIELTENLHAKHALQEVMKAMVSWTITTSGG